MKKEDIHLMLGRVEQKIDSLTQYVRDINEINAAHFKTLDDKVNALESFQDNLKGKISVFGAIGGFVGGIIVAIFNWFLKDIK